MPPELKPNQTYIQKGGQQLGPFDDAFILTSLGNGTFEYGDLCWREGWEDWKPLESFYPKPKGSTSSPPSQPTIQRQEETTLWEGRPSMLTFLGLWILVAVTIWFGLGLIFLGMIFWQYHSWKYTVTSQRVMIETGILVKSSNQLRIRDIRSINVTKSGLEGLLFGLGSLELSTAATADAEVVFRGIVNADKVRDLISDIQVGMH